MKGYAGARELVVQPRPPRACPGLDNINEFVILLMGSISTSKVTSVETHP